MPKIQKPFNQKIFSNFTDGRLSICQKKVFENITYSIFIDSIFNFFIKVLISILENKKNSILIIKKGKKMKIYNFK